MKKYLTTYEKYCPEEDRICNFGGETYALSFEDAEKRLIEDGRESEKIDGEWFADAYITEEGTINMIGRLDEIPDNVIDEVKKDMRG